MATIKPSFLQDDGQDWRKKLETYAADKTAAQTEYDRSQQVQRYKSALGDNEGANAAKTWGEQVSTAGGLNLSQPNAASHGALERYGKLADAMQQREQFSYDPNTDVNWQTGLAQIQQQAKVAGNNAMVSMGARGIGNSSAAVDRGNQIQQQAATQATTQLLPQLFQQAYSRWKDKQSLQQQDFQNAGSVLDATNSLYQQSVTNDLAQRNAANAEKGANWQAYLDSVGLTQNLGTGPKSDWRLLGGTDGAPTAQRQQYNEQFAYQQARDAIADKQYQQKFDEDVRQFGLNYALQQAQVAGQLANQGADNSLARDRLNWEMNPNNPDNMYKTYQAGGGTSSGKLTANQLLSSIRKTYTDPLYNKITADPKQREQMFFNVVDSGLSDSETDQILLSLGMTKTEIESYLKKYTGN